MKTAQERAQDRRREKLAAVEKQIRDGTLVVRQMTDKERARYPPRSAPPKRA
jgi:anti-sigma28 factor (negative regulator of flagellin synthesis)